MVNSIPELEVTVNSSYGIGIDFKNVFLIGIYLFFFFFLGIGIDFVGIIDLILLIFTLMFTYITFKIIFVCY